jgi:hypothetical protein
MTLVFIISISFPSDINNLVCIFTLKSAYVYYPEEVGEITKTISTTTEKYNIGKAMQYFPDSYIQYIFPFGIPEHLQEDSRIHFVYNYGRG